MSGEGFVRELRLTPPDGPAPRSAYPWGLPAVAAVAGRPAGLALHPAVTYLVGENGSGKSTLLEAVAVAAGINPEGGSTNFSFATRESHSEVGEHASLVRGARRPRTDFFLRAESLFTAATYLDDLAKIPFGGNALAAYGGTSLHEQSHGESFLAVMINRFGPDGLYLLAYPDATIYVCDESGIEAVSYEDAEPVRLTQHFLAGRERFLAALFDD